MSLELTPVASDEERGLPKQPKKPIVSNPSTPGVQTPNKPDGRDAPPPATTRGAVTELLDASSRNLAAGGDGNVTVRGNTLRLTRLTRNIAKGPRRLDAGLADRVRVVVDRGTTRERRPSVRRTRAASRSPGGGEPPPDADRLVRPSAQERAA